MVKRDHLDEQFVARRKVRDLPATIERLETDPRTLTEHADGDIGGRALTHEDFRDALAAKLETLPANVTDPFFAAPLGGGPAYRIPGFHVPLQEQSNWCWAGVALGVAARQGAMWQR
ncbi:MAG: hypothetical protein U0836_17595 [Pirellulales bacterium]